MEYRTEVLLVTRCTSISPGVYFRCVLMIYSGELYKMEQGAWLQHIKAKAELDHTNDVATCYVRT